MRRFTVRTSGDYLKSLLRLLGPIGLPSLFRLPARPEPPNPHPLRPGPSSRPSVAFVETWTSQSPRDPASPPPLRGVRQEVSGPRPNLACSGSFTERNDLDHGWPVAPEKEDQFGGFCSDGGRSMVISSIRCEHEGPESLVYQKRPWGCRCDCQGGQVGMSPFHDH